MIRSIVKKELLPSIKNNQEFITAIQLSRILSALRYNQVIYEKLIDEDDIFSNIYLNLFYNHAAFIFEGIRTFKKLESKLKNLECYKKYFKDIEKILKNEKDRKSFFNQVFGKIRNRITFHFDERVIKKIFKVYVEDSIKKQEDIIFLAGKTELIKDMNYVLAGDMNINYILKYVGNETLSEEDKFKNLVKKLTDLSKLFSEIIEYMMVELSKDCCEKKET